MLLAVDIGNTNCVFALYNGRELIKLWRVATDRRDFLQLLDFDISSVVVASTSPKALDVFTEFCQGDLKLSPLIADYRTIPVATTLKNKREIGADRLVNAFAVLQKKVKLPAIVVDLGTATTFDVIDARGRYIGGAIGAGVRMSLAAMANVAEKLPNIDVSCIKKCKAIGDNTESAMTAGVYWGHVGAINGTIARISNELPKKPYIILTGGLSRVFVDDINNVDEVDENLTINGLAELSFTKFP